MKEKEIGGFGLRSRVSGGTRSSRKAAGRRRQKLRLVMGICLALLAVAGTGAGTAVSFKPRLPANTFVMGVPVGGLTRDEAVRKVESYVDWSKRKVLIKNLTWTPIALSAIGFYPKIEETIDRIGTVYWWKLPYKRADHGLVVGVDDGRFDAVMTGLRVLVERPPYDARLVVDESDRVTIIKETPGVKVNAAKVKDALLGTGTWTSFPSVVEAPLEAVEPKVTEKSLREMGISGLVSSFYTYPNKDTDRTENIRLAASRIDGTVIAPGEVFSFNEIVGPRTIDDGYRETPIYWRDEIQRGPGGGVCQLSTTLYNAVLLADLEIVERHHHSLTVDYVPLGRDAAVSYGEIDFKFRNNTRNYLLIKSYVAGGKVWAKIFGTPEEGRRVIIKHEVLKKVEPPVETVVDPSIPAGRTEVKEGKPGYLVKTERIVYLDGKEGRRESLGFSSYFPLKKTIKVGPPAKGTAQSDVANLQPGS